MKDLERLEAAFLSPDVPVIHNLRPAGGGEYFFEFRGRTQRTYEGAMSHKGDFIPLKRVHIASAR